MVRIGGGWGGELTFVLLEVGVELLGVFENFVAFLGKHDEGIFVEDEGWVRGADPLGFGDLSDDNGLFGDELEAWLACEDEPSCLGPGGSLQGHGGGCGHGVAVCTEVRTQRLSL